MKLYRVAPVPNPQLMIVAETTTEAAEIAMTYSVSLGRLGQGRLMIEQYDTLMTEELQLGLDALLERGVPGVATYIEGLGWLLKPPG